MTCTLCHAPIPESSRFCMSCGADLSDPEISTRARAAIKELAEAIRVAVAGHYRITEMLGRGGMGAVFLAEDLQLGRTVAIKVLRPELAGEASFVGRFEREARIAARLDHPNIIPMYAVEEVGGLHYFVMKYIAGKSIDELLTGEPFAVEHCRQVLWQAACGLGHAHQRGVVHRDIKPSNIMIDESGRAIITDFGISKALQQDTQYTLTGQMLGTPRYVSPEQAQGIPVDGRSDQYSLAVMGYQMAVGRLPFIAGNVHALLFKHIYEVPPTAQSVRPEIPAGISETLQRALAKDPADRFPTMEDFASAIWPERPVRAGQPTPTIAGLTPLANLISSRRPRRRAAVLLAAAVAALVIAFFAGRHTEPAPSTIEEVNSARLPRPAPGTPLSPSEATRPRTPSPDSVGILTPPAAARESLPDSTPPVRTAPAAKQRKTPRNEISAPRSTRSAGAPTPLAPPAASVGFLTVNTVPYGTVSIDGVEVGDTPIVRRQLPPGEHSVRIARPGFRREDVTVTVTAGNEVRVSRPLIKDSL